MKSVLTHPGYANTNLQSSGPTGLMKQLMKVSNRLIAQSAEMGALPELYAAADPAARLPWYGPDMGLASSVTARIMETWAHGQDVYDALDVTHPPTAALYDVARLCSRTRANSYAAHGRAVPDGDVIIELVSPNERTWTFGEPSAERITGSAVEFSLVATQRRNLADTSLVADGTGALEWLEIAQAFAGPPGAGRPPLDA